MKRGLLNIVTLFVLMGAMCVELKAQEKKKEVFVGDRVIAVVGDRMILESDLLTAELYLKEANRLPFTEKFSDAEVGNLLDQLMTQKLLAAQAQLDSLDFSYEQLQSNVDARAEQLVEQFGSVAAVEERYKKPLYMLKVDLSDQLREQTMSQMMTQEVQNKVIITPDEVKAIIKDIPKDSLPLIPEQYEYSHIVIKAPSTEDSRSAVKESLLEIRARIMDGSNFAALATLYSDHESAKRGGEMTVSPQMVVPAFADAMVSLPVGGVSNIIETDEGFHLIQLISKQGKDKYVIRQILMRTKFSLADMKAASEKLDSIRNIIIADSMTFAEAAKKFSDDTDSKLTGGVVVNSAEANYTGQASAKTTKFYANELASDYNAVAPLAVGEISEPYQSYDESGNIIIKIVMLNTKTEEHVADIKNDYTYLVRVATNIKKQKAFVEWLKEQKQKMYIRIEEPYRSYAIIKEGWSK